MKRLVLVIVFIAVLTSCFTIAAQWRSQGWPRGADQSSTTVPNSESEKRILATIRSATQADELYLNVPESDGRVLRLLTETANAGNVVEIGTSTGISGLWLCMALEKTGGHLTTFEYDAARAATARKHFRQAGVDKLVTVVEGDAHKTIAQLKPPIDVVFIDADKEGYVDYLNKLLPLVRPGGLILAHNSDSAPDYVKAVIRNPALETTFFTGGSGLAVTLKKR
jgi:caffeoyl-CoA O-methyltransferase